MATQNNFKSSAICGIFTNADYPDGSILANGTFNRDLYVNNNLYLGNETGTTGSFIDTGANISFKVNGITYTLTPAIMQILITISSQSLATQTYVNNQISALVASAPSTLDTLYELAQSLGNDPNFATTVTNNIATKASKTAVQTISGANLMDNSGNVFYGDGSNLSGVLKTLPSALMYRNLTQTITAVHTYNVIPVTSVSVVPTTDYQFVNKKFCDDTYVSSAGVPLFQDSIYTNGSSLVGQNASGFNIASTGATPTITISPNNITAISINSSGLTSAVPLTINGLYIGNNTDMPSNTSEIRLYTNIWMDTINENYMRFFNKSTTATGGFGFYCGSNSVRTLIIDNTGLLSSVPITSTSTVSGATLQSSGNIYLTNSSAFILTNTANANLSVGTPTDGGGLYLNGQGIKIIFRYGHGLLLWKFYEIL